MSQIVSTRRIDHPAASVYAVAKQVERFPDVLPDLNKVEVLKDEGNGVVVTRWLGTIRVGPLTRQISWTERDYWHDAELRCVFELIEGDMKDYSGSWDFNPAGDGCEVSLVVNFELGIPMLGAMVNRMVDQLMQKNCDELLEALDQLAAGS